MARKGRARRFREARELKQGFEDGLFAEGEKTLADLEDGGAEEEPDWRADNVDDKSDWDDEDPLRIDEGGRQAS